MKKYLKYAIGEILLVVIGILIALQINNWNEHNKSINQKNLYCKQLISSLDSDLNALKSYRLRLINLDKNGNYLWEFVNGTKKVIDTNLTKNYFLSVASTFDFTPKTTAYENLISSNRLSFIQSDTLKNILALYFVPQKGADEAAQQRIQYASAYNDYRFEFVSPMMLKKYLHELFGNSEDFVNIKSGNENWDELMHVEVDLSEFDIKWEKLKKSEQYKIYLGRMLAIRIPQLDETTKSEKLIQKMKQLLEKEIK